ncbi:MAG: Uma2 family endonuclease [Desertifilum sp.]|nr:Uma2 family endonuclease [Desertifilum sp.]
MISPITEHLYTFAEYLNYDDGTDNRYELVEGRLELVNPPTIQHFLLAKFIERLLDAEINRLGLDWLCFKEVGVRTGKNKSRLTDICVVTSAQAKELITESAVFETPPLLVVEVVSPESISRDYRRKRSEYAALEVPEYWIVDPLKNQVCVLLLEEGLYEESVFTGSQPIISDTFPELAITVEQILAAGNIS